MKIAAIAAVAAALTLGSLAACQPPGGPAPFPGGGDNHPDPCSECHTIPPTVAPPAP